MPPALTAYPTEQPARDEAECRAGFRDLADWKPPGEIYPFFLNLNPTTDGPDEQRLISVLDFGGRLDLAISIQPRPEGIYVGLPFEQAHESQKLLMELRGCDYTDFEEENWDSCKQPHMGLGPIRGEKQAVFDLDIADDGGWKDCPPFIRNATVFPVSERDNIPNWHCGNARNANDTGRAQASSSTQPQPANPDSDEFLQCMKESLHIDSDGPPLAERDRPARLRSTSSEYPSPGHASPRVQSPASTVCVHKLSFSDLARFGRANDRLSYLRSSTPTSSTHGPKADESQHDVLDEASAAISEWRGEAWSPRKPSYSHYEFADSSEVLPDDSLSQRPTPSPFDPDPGSPSIKHRDDPRSPRRRNWDRLQLSKEQYDGPADAQGQGSPAPGTAPAASQARGASAAATGQAHQTKRKASQFSLRSLTRSLTKRPRLASLRRLADTVRRGGSRRITRAYRRWKQQNEMERVQFEAWRANRRREHPADPLKGKAEKGFGVFSFEKTRYGDEEWWKEGVAKYQAPAWMLFQK
ncbi:Lysophospholipase like protein [Purpureocillium lavendulum]|uniref:Lysophospholipase like protein n=1 Tax=Purpureocillium lavendulum TaxID=1247861 RepID=A0AB34FZK5_9HYPO|nr:Lysophospholipase like protein [Purpureocillium lavendulum]